MGHCPICGAAANLEGTSGGDYERVDCVRCGRFQITGSALAMLKSRLSNDPIKARARLSHATRMMRVSAEGDWPEINSVNLDALVTRPLPKIDQQIVNLLNWVTASLGDDELGAVELPDEEQLTAVVGTIDGEHVSDLITLAETMDFLKRIPENCVVLTRGGSKQLSRHDAQSKIVAGPGVERSSEVTTVTVRAHCGKCGGTRNAWVRASYSAEGSDGPIAWSDTYQVLECCGCETPFVRNRYWFSEWDSMDYDDSGQLRLVPGIKETYYPAPAARVRPAWLAKVTDDVLRRVFDELYSALNSDLRMLATVGARTLLDRAGYLLVGDPRGGFEGKLSTLLAAGHISIEEKEILDAVADAGNASAHRGYVPTPQRLSHIVDIIENFVHRAFVLTNAAREIRTSTPTRKTP